MRDRKTYMYINFQQNWVNRTLKIVHTIFLPKNCKLHEFATCNSNLKKSRLSDMHYPLTTFRPILGSIGLLDVRLPRKEIIYTDGRTARQTDGRTDVAYDNNRYFFSKKEKTTEKQPLPPISNQIR